MSLLDGYVDRKKIIIEHAIMGVLAKYELHEEKLCREQVCGDKG